MHDQSERPRLQVISGGRAHTPALALPDSQSRSLAAQRRRLQSHPNDADLRQELGRVAEILKREAQAVRSGHTITAAENLEYLSVWFAETF
jgi:hypothetical protein